MNLILYDTNIDMNLFKNININTLIIGAEKDLIYHKHLKEISLQIKNSNLIIVPKCTHFNIYKDNHSINIIDEFLN